MNLEKETSLKAETLDLESKNILILVLNTILILVFSVWTSMSFLKKTVKEYPKEKDANLELVLLKELLEKKLCNTSNKSMMG